MRGDVMMPPPHAEVAAFVLGVLDDEENEVFELHLAECAACQAELRELYVLPGLLDEVKPAAPADPEPSESMLDALLDDVAAARRRRRRLLSLGAAAAVALIAVTPPATRWLWPGSPDIRADTVAASSAPKSPAGTEILRATNRVTAVTAKITIEPKGWGSQVNIELSGVRGQLHCQLVVVTHSGKSEVVTSWQVPARQGYGVPGSPKPLIVQGGTAHYRGDIQRFEVRTTTGPNLVDVPA
jgi:hypothetical protein